ncbi:MAG: MFS transporter [Planctomycetes bacterium]|nr:MFS transporter [Planctomycetota bacterium]
MTEGLVGYLRFLSAHRRFLVFGFTLAFFSSFGQTFFISLFGEKIRATFDLTHGSFGLCYSLATLASGFTIIWLGKKLDDVDLRVFSVLLCAGLAAACLGMSVAPVVAALAVAIYLLRLTGQGLLSHTAMTSMARYFHEQRGKAMSVAGLGFPAGEAVLPIAAVLVMTQIGWRQTWLAIAVAVGLLVIPLVIWLLRGHHVRHAEHVETLARAERDAASGDSTAQARTQWSRRQVLRDLRFYLLLPAVMAPGFIVTGVFFHQVHLVETKGWELTWFAGCFAVYAATQLPSGLIAGPLVDRFGATRLLPVFLLPMTLSLVVLAMSSHVMAAPLFMALAGITGGIGSPIVGSMWAEVYGVRHLGAIRAMVTAIMVFGTAGSPVGMGWLIDAGVTMEAISWMCCAYTVIATVVAWVALRR